MLVQSDRHMSPMTVVPAVVPDPRDRLDIGGIRRAQPLVGHVPHLAVLDPFDQRIGRRAAALYGVWVLPALSRRGSFNPASPTYGARCDVKFV
jgi:hypothetical protein